MPPFLSSFQHNYLKESILSTARIQTPARLLSQDSSALSISQCLSAATTAELAPVLPAAAAPAAPYDQPLSFVREYNVLIRGI